jgi:hypothetical protein
MTRERKIKFFAATFILLTCGVIIYYFSYSLLKRAADNRPTFLTGREKISLTVQGFRFDGYFKDRHILSIKADKHTIEKKKIGFISLGTGFIANYKNAVIDIYVQQTEKTRNSRNDSPAVAYSFNEIFSKEIAPIFSQKDIVALQFQPVKINFFRQNKLLSQIQANSAIIRSLDGRIFLKGKISVNAADKVLSTDRMTLVSDSGLMETNDHFILTTPEKQITGKTLISDIGLNIVKP